MWVSWWLALCFGAISLEKQVESLQVQKHTVKIKEQWKYIDFKFPNDKERKEAIDSGRYDYKKCVPVDVDEWQGTTFVTVIGLGGEGAPATLNTVSKEKGDGGPLLKPYPDWSWHNQKDCDKPHLIRVHRIAIDKCDRLWVLDTGMSGSKATCPPQLLMFDLTDNKVKETITIPKEVAVNSNSGAGLLVTPIVRTLGSSCRETQVYIADPYGYAILVYNSRSSKWSRVTSSALDTDPSAATYTVDNQSFDFNMEIGPLGMALSPTGRKLYLSSLSSRNMLSVNTDKLVKAEGVDDSVPFDMYKDILPTQSSAKAMSKEGTLFFGLVNSSSIACWNENNPLTEDNMLITVQSPEILQFIDGMKIIERNDNKKSEEIMMALTNSFQKIETNTVNFKETNFRIVESDVTSLTKGSVCDPRTGH